MNQFEFIKFEKTPGEKYHGIAYVKSWGKITLRYKIMPNKEGTGYFLCIDAHKRPGEEGSYEDAFMIDSRSDEEEVKSIVRKMVNQEMANTGAQQMMPNQHLPQNPQWQPNQYIQPQVQQQNWTTNPPIPDDSPLPF